MKILATAGNTQTLIDRVRCITNIFSGRTGAQIAATAFDRGHDVTVLTSHPHVLNDIPGVRQRTSTFRVQAYQTFEDLEKMMSSLILSGEYDAVVHAAAVNDYHVVGTYANTNRPSDLVDVGAGKIKSTHQDLWIRLRPAPKLIDKIRTEWNFTGMLIKFKLEVGVSDDELLRIAEHSRRQSKADFIVANTLEGMHDCAFVGSDKVGYCRIQRHTLADTVVREIERSNVFEKNAA